MNIGSYVKYLKTRVNNVYSCPCPTIAIFDAIDIMAEWRWLANRHAWKAGKDAVVANLKANFYNDLRYEGALAIWEEFEEMFPIGMED